VTRPTNESMARALLESFSQDQVSAQAKKRAFAAFGMAAGVASVSTTATGSAEIVASAGAPGASMVAKGLITAGGFSTVKALIAGAVVGAVVVHAGQRMATYFGDTPPSSSPVVTRAADPADPALGPTLPSPDVPPGRAEEDPALGATGINSPPPAPIEPLRARARAVARAAPPASIGAAPKPTLEQRSGAPSAALAASVRPSSPATLTGEVVRLDRARAALREGSSSRALRELDGYDAEFANGALRQEATVLRIELLVEMGDEARARALAGAFASAHPRSGYLNKLRELLARESKRPAP